MTNRTEKMASLHAGWRLELLAQSPALSETRHLDTWIPDTSILWYLILLINDFGDLNGHLCCLPPTTTAPPLLPPSYPSQYYSSTTTTLVLLLLLLLLRMASANCKSPRNEKSALTMDSLSASLFPPLALTYIPCCYSPSSFALSCDLSSTTTSTEDTPPPFSLPSSPLLHLQHHHTCLRCRLQLPAPQLSTESISPPHLSQISIAFSIRSPILENEHNTFVNHQKSNFPQTHVGCLDLFCKAMSGAVNWLSLIYVGCKDIFANLCLDCQFLKLQNISQKSTSQLILGLAKKNNFKVLLGIHLFWDFKPMHFLAPDVSIATVTFFCKLMAHICTATHCTSHFQCNMSEITCHLAVNYFKNKQTNKCPSQATSTCNFDLIQTSSRCLPIGFILAF